MSFNTKLRYVKSVVWGQPWLILTLPFAVIVLVLVVLIRPVRLVRFGLLRSDRLGHFAANHELFLCEDEVASTLRPVSTWDVYYFGRLPPCNQQLADMWSRRLRVWPAAIVRPCWLIARFSGLLERHVCGDGMAENRDVSNVLHRSQPHIRFTQTEEHRGARILRDFGLDEGARFVCVTVRDVAYTREIYGSSSTYHDYRNSDIRSFELAMLELANRGIYVLRMGSRVESPLEIRHPKILDYATNGMRSDFMDVYLGAHCYFCISTSTGFDAIPQIFRRPILYVNHAPVGDLMTWSHLHLCLAKRYVQKNSGKILSLRESLASPVAYAYQTESFEHHGVRLQENSPEQIRDAAVEMFDLLSVGPEGIEEDPELQHRFREIMESHVLSSDLGRLNHGKVNCRYSSSFLESNRWFLE